MATTARKVCVLFDADNITPDVVPRVLDAITKHIGDPVIKRAYGDWSLPHLAGWQAVLKERAISGIHQPNLAGKNSSDMALAIDAMDLLHQKANDIQVFCIVASDGDYTRLAQRIRESNIYVVGFGAEKTPKPFAEACSKFITLEKLAAKVDDVVSGDLSAAETASAVQKSSVIHAMHATVSPLNGSASTRVTQPAPVAASSSKASHIADITPLRNTTVPEELKALIIKAWEESAKGEGGWVNTVHLGQSLLRLKPNYKQQYGFSTLSKLVRSCSTFLIWQRTDNGQLNVKPKRVA